VNEGGIAHVCLHSSEMLELLQRWHDAGGGANSPPVDLGTGFRYCYARDLEGHVWELEQLPRLPASHWPPGQVSWLAHASVAVADLDRAVAFYAGLLGGEVVRSRPLGGRPQIDELAALPDVQLAMAWLDAGNQQVELIHYLHPPTLAESPRRRLGAGGWIALVFEAEDVPAALARVRLFGGRVTDASNGAAEDTEGNALRFLERATLRAQGRAIEQMPDPTIRRRFAAARQAHLAGRSATGVA
jgi:catechol 2,3-dioxygenase-like lactoylglutathione lyase family enzyme